MALEERARSCLLRFRHRLEQDIKPPYLMDHMISDGVLTGDEEERIRTQSTRKDQAVALLELLLKKDNHAYISFYNALVREAYDDLANLLYDDLPKMSQNVHKSNSDSNTSYVQTVLSEGGVPQRPVVFVSRPELVNRVREKLYRLQKDPGWVTVFGMAGSGKSVLAAEAVRDQGLIEECFPGGIHWLSIGQLDKPDLLVKIQSLCFRLEQSLDSQSLHRPPNSLDEAKERMRFLMLRRYPRALLILDDIWDSTVLKVFDIHCRILLTTRNRSLADSVSGAKYEVEVESGLDEKKGLEILALYTGTKPIALPEEACSIVRECKGRKQFKRIRKSSSYDYDALDQAMAASIEVLPDEHRELYKDLTVLEKDIKIPAKVLSVLWDLEPEEVEDILQEFVNKSLLFVDSHNKPYLYYLHDLQLDFLVEQNRTQLENLHSKVVHQYQQHYKDGPPTSGDEECLYWIRFLTFHMAKGNLSQELYSLMFSLDWVSIKAKIMGPAHLINDYVEYGHILDKENSDVRSQFQEFLSLNGHQLEQRPFPDVVQLALSQPRTSEVYRQALLQAQDRTSKGKLYFDWLNKSSVESLSRLVIHPHQGSIYSACFSHDGAKIASSGASKTLKVFKSTSGEKLTEIPAHDDEVLCCAFSPDDRLLATCSSDRKVKVWNVERAMLLRVFEEEHEEQVNHCQFTNTTRRLLLATCSNDKMLNVKLWNLNKPTSQNTMFGHFEPVNHCCFSPDDTYVSTSSNDGTLKSANEWKTINVRDMFAESDEDVLVKCSTWTADGKRVICAAKNAALVFDVETSDMLLEIRTNRLSTVQYCHACPTSNLLALAFSNYAVELWDLEANKKMADCSGHLSWVQRVQFSPDGSQLLSCSYDQTIRLWETKKVHTTSAVCLKRDSDVLFNDEEIIVSAADNCNRLQVRDGRTGSVLFQSEEKSSRIRCMSMCRQPSAVALGQEDGTVQVLEVPSGKTLATLEGHTKTVLHCQFCQNGQTLITSSEDTAIRTMIHGQPFIEIIPDFCMANNHTATSWTRVVWRWQSGECKVLQGHKEQVRCFSPLSNSPDNTRLLSWSFDGTVKMWDVESGEKLQDIEAHRGAILSCHASPDGCHFATTSADKTAKLWHCESWQCVHTLSGHLDCVRSCRFSWDSRRLATGDDNGEIRLWSVKDGSLLKICSRDGKDGMDSLHGGWVTDLHFSSDNSLLVSTGGYIKWWDVEKGEALQTFYPSGTALKRIHVSSDFSTFVTIDNIGILYILKRVDTRILQLVIKTTHDIIGTHLWSVSDSDMYPNHNLLNLLPSSK
ncbi:Apoptotic protease-activating factor 1 [Collichthys lucidus]|uniref:Apoptotic protease-activating factor 1 n=1 Tax=Collichthys lucidus TaxID=240159 RepID=A0A4U5VS23_COLLU|nr:Apoptotic protease-activating factor 1 [Collichthys lucidus]